ncbi:MAG TPA: hypothetical protein VH478_25815 [Trebonia sp.]|nr:hypothetical protein [Trebonia sp.]
MSGDPFDAQGEAHEALSTAVSSYGARVLSDPRILGNLVTDLLPDSPRERSLLVTAAEAGVATDLAQHVDQQHLDVDTAISMVARGLSEHRSIDLAASTWVATEYAQALGYQVQQSSTPAGQFSDVPSPTATVRRPASSPPPFGVTPSPPTVQSPGTPPPFGGAGAPGGQQPSTPPPYQGQGYQPTIFQPPQSQPPFGQPSSQPQGFQQPASSPPPYGQQPSSPPPYGQQASTPQYGQQPSSPPPFGQQASSPSPGGYPGPSYGTPGSQPSSPYQPGGPSTPTAPYPGGTPQGGPQQAGFQAPGFQSPYQQPGGGPPWPGGGQPAIGGRKPRRGLLFGGIGVAVVIVVVIIVVVATSGGNKPKPKPIANGGGSSSVVTTAPPTTPPTTAPPTTPAPSPTTQAPLPASVKPLQALLPSDIDDFETECKNQTLADLPFKPVGLRQALKCDDPGLPNGTVFAFQFDSAYDYVQSFKAFNTWWGFTPSTAGTSCPPSGSSATAQGVSGWHSDTYPQHSGQEVECQYVTVNGTSTVKSNLEPDYVWSYPTQWAFIDGQGAAGSSFSALQTWWTNT